MPSRKSLLIGLITFWSLTLLLVTVKRHGIYGDSTEKLPTIFISIASYRDIQCMHTVLDAFSKARHKHRLFVGVVQQNDEEKDIDCLTAPPDRLDEAHLLEEYKDNIRIHRVNYKIAKGPTWARHMVIDKLFRGEDFVFQIDSHTRFVPDWDLILMNNVALLPPKSCISHYPSTWDPKEHGNQLPKDYDLMVARMCKGFYNNEHILIPVCGLMTLKERRSVPALIAGAGMTLYPGSVHKDMDMDPHLPFLFQGEELLFTMRMVSKGYKVFSPAENVVFHYYGRKDHAKFFDLGASNPEMEKIRQWSLQRAKYIMGYLEKEKLENPEASLIEIDKYKIDWEDPIVKARMDKYFQVFQIDLKEKKVGDFCVKDELDDWPTWD